MVKQMAENDYKINSGVIQPPPPSIASDSEFNAGTSTTASPTVKQCKEKLVTTDTNQVITGTKVFISEPQRKSTVIDITTQPGNYTSNNAFRFLDKNDQISGYIENAQMASGEITTGIHAKNKDGYQPHISIFAPLSGTTGAYAIAPSTPEDAPVDAITTKGYVQNNYVDTTSTQTISGNKRFTQPSSGMSIDLMADTNQQTVPATYAIRKLGLYLNSTHTKGDGYTSWIQGYRGSDGWTSTELYTRRFLESDSQEIINYLKANITPGGIPVSYTKTPPAYVSNDEIVTAGWFNSKMQIVSTLPANPDPNVFYFIPE